MARQRGSRFKLARREGVNVTGTTSPRLEEVINIPPGGRKRPRKRSDYGLRLRAKQRVKKQYGLQEKQLRRFFNSAQKASGPTGLNLLQLLERRLDNVIYRLGYVRTRPMARQVVGHGHVRVNGKRVNVPSSLVKPGDVVELTSSAIEILLIKGELATRPLTPSWLERNGNFGKVTGTPQRNDIDADIREDLIVESYAR